MEKKMIRMPVVIVLCLMIGLCSSDVFAWRGGNGGGHGDHGDHFYRNGNWYKHGWFGFDVVVTALMIGALVEGLPPRHTTVVVGGVPYYYSDNVYYRPYPGGYVVVPAPVMTQPIVVAPAPIIVQAQGQPINAQTVNIPNSKGGYTAVTLQKSGNGYIGPQGEYYSENPTVEQLKTLYGK
jgi:hypothetical protein